MTESRERKKRGIDSRYEWEVREIRRTNRFAVVRLSGRDAPRVRVEVGSVAEALAKAEEVGPDPYGRTPMIYAITVGEQQSIHVDERHLRMLNEERS